MCPKLKSSYLSILCNRFLSLFPTSANVTTKSNSLTSKLGVILVTPSPSFSHLTSYKVPSNCKAFSQISPLLSISVAQAQFRDDSLLSGLLPQSLNCRVILKHLSTGMAQTPTNQNDTSRSDGPAHWSLSAVFYPQPNWSPRLQYPLAPIHNPHCNFSVA